MGRLRFLVAESESPRARQERRERVGSSSGETFIGTLGEMAPGAACDRVKPADDDHPTHVSPDLSAYDAVFLTGSPLHVYEDTPQVRRQVEFMRAVFASGTPAFGSCAGIQVATAAAGGTVRPAHHRREAGFARRIHRTAAGQDHPFLHGRPQVFDALSVHTDEVESLPPSARLLATNGTTAVQAAEIRHDGGIFWGVQYHPELSLHEVGRALEREADELVEAGFASDHAALQRFIGQIDLLDSDPGRDDLAWQLGLDQEVINPERRRIEIRNFIEHLVKPTRSSRGRA